MNMNLSDREQGLVNAMAELEVIDAQEHMGPEKGRLGMDVDVFTLFSHYTHGDLLVASVSERRGSTGSVDAVLPDGMISGSEGRQRHLHRAGTWRPKHIR